MPRSAGSVDAKLLSDRYEILEPLGVGTAATVYKVRDRRTGVLRAAKVLAPENAANPKVLARFEDEFRILRTLHHPHLAEVYDYGWTPEGGRFLVMELVDGVPLDQFFRANPGDIWAILYELCETLTFVHNHKLLHHDIKPSNILVKRTTAYGPDLPLVKLIDFGVMYRRDTGAEVELVGTPEYMAPEVARGDSNLTRAVDYYSLGATLFELLVGRPPFVGSAMEVMRAHLEREPAIEEEVLEWAELYPHVRGLLSKNARARLEAFERFRQAVLSRLTGGIEELDRAYAIARTPQFAGGAESSVDAALTWLGAAELSGDGTVPMLDIQGQRGPIRNRILDVLSAESAIRGVHVVRLVGDGKDILHPDAVNLRQVDRFNRVITRLHSSRTALIVIDGIEHLADEPVSFIRYLSTKREFAVDRANVVLFAIARRWRSVQELDAYLPVDRMAIDLPLDPQAEGTPEQADVSKAGYFIEELLKGNRTYERRRLMAYIASHPAPVPVTWAREFAGGSAVEFANDLDTILTLHLATKVTVDGSDALSISEDVRESARGVVSPEVRKDIHRDLAQRTSNEIGRSGASSTAFDLVARHQAAVGEDRAATIAGIRAVQAAWRERTLARVERLAQRSLERMDASKSYSPAARRHFVKQWVSALWARNQHTKAKQVIDAYVVERHDVISPTLLPKYIRGILDASGPGPALEFCDAIDGKALSIRVRQQVALERALIYWHRAQHQESQEILATLRSRNVLSTRDRFRAVIYEAMNLADLGDHRRVETLLSRASQQAQMHHALDEVVLMSAIRAQSRTLRGSPREALRIISQTMRIAHGHELYLRLNALYRLAATAYRDLGQPQKALLSQRKALSLASTLGLSTNEALSWARLAEYELSLGHYGNALKYVEKAKCIIAKSGMGTDRASISLLALNVHSWLRSPELDRVLREARWIEQMGAPNERGRYFLMGAIVSMDRDNLSMARNYLDKALVDLERAGLVDNLIMVRRARMRLNVMENRSGSTQADYMALNSESAIAADSATGQLERNLALLESHYARRSSWKTLAALCESCLSLVEGPAEARLKLDALVLVFRVYARKKKYEDADAVFSKISSLIKLVSGSLPEQYLIGALQRIDASRLMHELDLLKRNKAGVTTSLVA